MQNFSKGYTCLNFFYYYNCPVNLELFQSKQLKSITLLKKMLKKFLEKWGMLGGASGGTSCMFNDSIIGHYK